MKAKDQVEDRDVPPRMIHVGDFVRVRDQHGAEVQGQITDITTYESHHILTIDKTTFVHLPRIPEVLVPRITGGVNRFHHLGHFYGKNAWELKKAA